jgi:hypothetical protein
MRKLAVVGLLLLLGPNLAYSAPLPGQPGERSSAVRRIAESKPLLYSLGFDASLVGIRQIRFVVKVDSRPAMRETIAVPAGQAGGGTFGLLAGRPNLRDRLYAVAEAGAKVTVSILGDGRELQTFSFQDFVRYNRLLKATARLQFRPLQSNVEFLDPSMAPPSPPAGNLRSIRARSAGWQLDPACTAACEAQRSDCEATSCTTPICDACNEAYESCASGCWVWTCTEPKDESYFMEREEVSSYWSGQTCIQHTLYDVYTHVYAVYLVTQIEHCDGSTSYGTPIFLSYTSDSSQEATQSSC